MLMTRLAKLGFAGLALCAVMICSGCGGPDYGSPVTVSGTVTVDGQPLSAASVTFHSTDAREAAYKTFTATTGDDGKYELLKVYPGAYEVIVAEGGGVSGDGMEDPGMASAAAGQDLQPASGELKTTVEAADHTYDVQLKRGSVSRR